MKLCSLGQRTVSPWSIVPRCPRVLLVLPTMSDSWDCETWDTWELSDIDGSTINTLHETAWNNVPWGDTLPCPKEKSYIVWTDLNNELPLTVVTHQLCLADACRMKGLTALA